MNLDRKWKRNLFTVARGITEVFLIIVGTILFCGLLQKLGAGMGGTMIGGAVSFIVLSVLVVMLVEIPVQYLLRHQNMEEETLPFENTSLDPDSYHHTYHFGDRAGVSEDAPEEAPAEPAEGTEEKSAPGSDYMPGFFGRSLKDFRWKPEEKQEEKDPQDEQQ